MALFLDSADITEIRSGMDLGVYSGVTTNPSLVARIPEGNRLEHYQFIAQICSKRIFLQVDWDSLSVMERQALALYQVAPGRTSIKVPMADEGIRLCQLLKTHAVPVCMTAVFTPAQAYWAASAGADTVAIYVGRLIRRGEDGVGVVQQASAALRCSELPARILAASIPDVPTLNSLLGIPGVDVTIPYRLQNELLNHPGTLEAIEQFSRKSGY